MAEIITEMISEQEIDKRVRELGKQISEDYAGKEVVLICILKGASFFMCELAKRIEVPVAIDFMSVTSYGKAMESSGIVRIIKDVDDPVEGKDIIIVEDIVDSGRTMYNLIELFKERNAASIRTCTLLDKPSRRVVEQDVDYIGFTVPDKYVVGYGMDYAQKYRTLPYIGTIRFTDED